MECSVNNFQFKQKIIKNITLQIQNQITKEIVIKGKVALIYLAWEKKNPMDFKLIHKDIKSSDLKLCTAVLYAEVYIYMYTHTSEIHIISGCAKFSLTRNFNLKF